MAILFDQIATGHPLKNPLAALRTAASQWREDRRHRTQERRTIAILQSLDRELLEDSGGAAYLAAKGARPRDIGRTEVGLLLAAYLPFWGTQDR